MTRGDVIIYKSPDNPNASMNGWMAVLVEIDASSVELTWFVQLISAQGASLTDNTEFMKRSFFYERNCQVIGHIELSE
jgi:hypothetical protein